VDLFLQNYVALSRVNHRPNVAVWPIQLQDELPLLPVSLKLFICPWGTKDWPDGRSSLHSD
jgi:hypothetical protein